MDGRFKKTFGQHILKNPGIVTNMIDKAKIKPTDTVLEIGPGTGNLTLKLLDKCKRVVAIEKDRKIASDLIKRIGARKNKLQLLIEDAIDANYPYFDLCVSNTPYQISSPLVFKLLEYPFRACVLMFQKEFADRLCAAPGTSSYCRLSVSVQIRAVVTHIMRVSKKNFRPPPKVESSIVKIEPRRNKVDIDLTEFDGMLRICFSRKNKTIGSIFRQNTIKNLLFMNRDKIADIAEEDDTLAEPALTEEPSRKISPEQEAILNKVLEESKLEKERAAKMIVEDFLFLLIKFKEAGISFKA
ncbi:18S rRNA (adenine1779-N6/adenine1780-N6)-dimethyltransferase [Nematocida parisii]|uniref:rRNA adenine N(6)-methyltransferase n=1 Tax=Nematocida parisii (strain ERTm3) TaxID=935791 RepID=I3EK34_NEMP3|nr:dimethyladenosine transferase [Nematocida parisii ERTm1]EIJ89581.1 dimethyladenosine transferase [Nematocida parisii ERTm3]KAI5128612.1 18S rRNA (adenine1779-N6/adenine1780-N6)-dimethyltransferase [Nematocida parisii]EIJ94218.1 dimethyladenosine transferase [Nematocida parisii ERTm1]KAI5128964.1 18S rRNA (adenine1779-N6/adenine1780-N6)-dimethyltransferase [Nematocida parisii]KAI5141482.1 18S rRNA (adenine1779-N6/adenine1780-N6)-dimethyltransferase [Nematocida parisii]|eukprot:XP_013058714.1 dimethyladenosine transferase [Nematocida parisii ERTm1]